MGSLPRSGVLLVRAWPQGEDVVARVLWVVDADERHAEVAVGDQEVHRLVQRWLEDLRAEPAAGSA